MNKKRIFSFIAWIFFSLLLVVGCNQASEKNTPPASPALNSAAPSTQGLRTGVGSRE